MKRCDRHPVHGGAARGEAVRGAEYSTESIDRTRHPKIFIGKLAGVPEAELAAALASLRSLATSGSSDEMRAFLGSFLPEAQLNGGAPPPTALTAGGSLGT